MTYSARPVEPSTRPVQARPPAIPIDTFREASLVDGMINDEQLARIDERVADTIAEAVKFAEESKEPSLESLFDDLYD